jgi:hypothetical protein
LDASTFTLMGHSFGGAAAFSALEGKCTFPFCLVQERDYPERPEELKAAVLYGTNLASPQGDPIPPSNLNGLPVGFIQGSADDIATPQELADTIALMTGGPTITTVLLEGLNHYGINGEATAIDEGYLSPTLPQSESIAAAAKWTAILLHSLLGDPDANQVVTDEITGDGDPLATVTRKVADQV